METKSLGWQNFFVFIALVLYMFFTIQNSSLSRCVVSDSGLSLLMRVWYTVPAVMEVELRRHCDRHPAHGGKLNSWDAWNDWDSLNNRNTRNNRDGLDGWYRDTLIPCRSCLTHHGAWVHCLEAGLAGGLVGLSDRKSSCWTWLHSLRAGLRGGGARVGGWGAWVGYAGTLLSCSDWGALLLNHQGALFLRGRSRVRAIHICQGTKRISK